MDFHVAAYDNLFVLRDDLLPGGTKYRGLKKLLQTIPEQKIVYAGTIMGHGALALAHACRDAGKSAEIHISASAPHPMLERLQMTGADIRIKEPQPIDALYEAAQTSCTGDALCLPPGFDMPGFETALADSLSGFDLSPYSEIWTTMVTGTLTRALKRAFPGKTFKTVKVVKSGAADFTAPEKYHQPAKSPPPYPSCAHTDAKLWQFASKHAENGALLWNTAG